MTGAGTVMSRTDPFVFVVFTIVYWFSYASFRKLIQRGWRLIRHKMNKNKEVQA